MLMKESSLSDLFDKLRGIEVKWGSNVFINSRSVRFKGDGFGYRDVEELVNVLNYIFNNGRVPLI